MNLAELTQAAQADFADTVGDADARLVKPAQWVRFANEAQREACRRAHLLVDSSTASICHLAVTAGHPVINLSKKILRVRGVRLASDGTVLAKIRVDVLDTRSGRNWQADEGVPAYYAEDFQSSALLLYPKPSSGDSLNLTVVRLPLADMAHDTDEPELPESCHEGLVKWMLYRAYSAHDVETENMPRAQAALAAFEAQFGPAISAKEDAWARARQGLDGMEGGF